MICLIVGILLFILNIWATTIVYYYCPIWLDLPVMLTGIIFGWISLAMMIVGFNSLVEE